jgi:hypothetical protein
MVQVVFWQQEAIYAVHGAPLFGNLKSVKTDLLRPLAFALLNLLWIAFAGLVIMVAAIRPGTH